MSENSNRLMLEVHGLNKRFGQVHAVSNLDFEVKKGEVFGFLGPNGAGKSTTMRMITCFIPPTSGIVRVDGLDTAEHDLAVRKKIGYLPESTPLYSDMTVREYLSFAGKVRSLRGNRLKERMDAMFSVCALTKMANRQIGKLSKGYRQRVGLAQAMIHDPDLLILDEPMSGLDPNQIIEIRHLIKRIGSEKTVIYCSHILSEVSATCGRILIIKDGRVVATGTPDELTSGHRSGSQYSLRLKGDKPSLKSGLASIEGVSGVSVDDGTDGWYDVQVNTASKDDIGEALFRCAVQNNWSLSELRRDHTSLEEVFTQLTGGGK
ncbi:MAG: ATP-binding cassette domain-containing protein [Chitinispirillia bacterium]|nr:ATP-binding cassette domain-containing protein [Chitinispirillia bacterium]MCL2268072.1 ATP-binding cassette domain-containing protein [Chitinispirillia bacterium]